MAIAQQMGANWCPEINLQSDAPIVKLIHCSGKRFRIVPGRKKRIWWLCRSQSLNSLHTHTAHKPVCTAVCRIAQNSHDGKRNPKARITTADSVIRSVMVQCLMTGRESRIRKIKENRREQSVTNRDCRNRGKLRTSDGVLQQQHRERLIFDYLLSVKQQEWWLNHSVYQQLSVSSLAKGIAIESQ